MVKRVAKLSTNLTVLIVCAVLVACVPAPTPSAKTSGKIPQAPTPRERPVSAGIPTNILVPEAPQAIPPQPTDIFHGPTSGENKRPVQNPAVIALLDRSYAEQQVGELDSAASTVERGMRIAPQDASLWQRLAQIRLQQGLLSQAIEIANKSNSLGQGMRRLLHDNWLLIARAYELLGKPGARQSALLEADRYRH